MTRGTKPDGSIITSVDSEVERRIRAELANSHPEEPIWGEELGKADPKNGTIWLIDPIDGTTNFAGGGPLWGVSIARLDSDGLQLGGIVIPDLGYSLIAERGCGAYWNGEQLPRIEHETTEAWSTVTLNDSTRKLLTEPLTQKSRCCGSSVVDGAFVVKRWFHSLTSVKEKLYDIAAIVLAAREVGLRVEMVDGTPLNEHSLVGGETVSMWRIHPNSLPKCY
jgi:fructose-1,6-bisphosphatase/inositol monophosphatase family enzyme